MLVLGRLSRNALWTGVQAGHAALPPVAAVGA